MCAAITQQSVLSRDNVYERIGNTRRFPVKQVYSTDRIGIITRTVILAVNNYISGEFGSVVKHSTADPGIARENAPVYQYLHWAR